MYKLLIYMIFPVATLMLGIFARNIPLPDSASDSFVTKQLQKISIFLYRLFFKKKKIPGSERVRSILPAIYEGKDIKEIEEEYYAGKISIAILMALAGSFLAMMLFLSSAKDMNVEEGGLVNRLAPGEGEQKLELVAKDSEGADLGCYELTVEERFYTEKEADLLFEEAAGVMESAVLGENESLDKVEYNLNLVKVLDGYPFEISWKTGNSEVIKYDGRICIDEIPKEGCPVELTATYKYDDRSWQQVLYVNIVQRQLTGDERIRAMINALLKEADEASKYDEKIALPDSFEDSSIIWSQKTEDRSIVLMILMLAAGGACFVLKDRELQKKIDERNAQMLDDYPRFISQLVLYLGAGMTVRNVFAKISEEYLRKTEKGAPKRHMYEELVKSTRELSTGKSEAEVLKNFGKRCSGQEYSRLCTLLSQNQKKGNGELLSLLQEESAKAFENRMSVVRKRGEEAGTKLLVPMILMLLVVMVVIMIPAYKTF